MIPSALLDQLKNIFGEQNVSLADDVIDQHSYDAWPAAVKWRQLGKRPYAPDCVVYAQQTDQISRLLTAAGAFGVPITPWGAGSSVTGASLPLDGGITLDLSQMNHILALDFENGLLCVQTGVMGHVLEEELNKHGWTLNHSPQSLNRSTVGGWIATRATGQFSSRYGGIEDLVVGLRVVLPTGEVIETKAIPRASNGPDLVQLFTGAEGTLGVVTEIILRMFPIAAYRRLDAVRFLNVDDGLTVMRQIMQRGMRPFLVRFYDQDEARHAMKDSTFSGCVMFLGFEGLQEIANAEYAAALALCAEFGGEALGAAPVEAWMNRRFDFSGVENVLSQPGGYAETIEVAHFWTEIGGLYAALKQALLPLSDEVLGHFSHVYTHGTSLYIILLGKADTDEDAETRILQFWETAMQICLEHEGALSHHHGIGLARLPYIEREIGTAHVALRRVKHALDPQHILSAGKLRL